jgi:hypothetical protein
MRSLWAIAATVKLAGSGHKFKYLIDKGYKYAPASSKIVEVSKTVAGGK